MAVLTEGVHRRGFLVSQANGGRSWGQGMVAMGQVLLAGTVCMMSGDFLVAHDAGTFTNGDGVGAVVLDDNIDATDEAKRATYLARDAEVNIEELVFPGETTSGGERAAIIAGLAVNGIIPRRADITPGDEIIPGQVA